MKILEWFEKIFDNSSKKAFPVLCLFTLITFVFPEGTRSILYLLKSSLPDMWIEHMKEIIFRTTNIEAALFSAFLLMGIATMIAVVVQAVYASVLRVFIGVAEKLQLWVLILIFGAIICNRVYDHPIRVMEYVFETLRTIGKLNAITLLLLVTLALAPFFLSSIALIILRIDEAVEKIENVALRLAAWIILIVALAFCIIFIPAGLLQRLL